MEHRLCRPCLAVLAAVLCLLLVPAVSAADDAAAPAADLFTAPATDCLAQSSALPAPAAEPETDLFQQAAPQPLPDNGLQLTSSSCSCPLERVGKKCTCPNCIYTGTCQLVFGNPRCLTVCAD